jgi:hypothetical protein
MSKIMIEGKLRNWIRISIYKHVQKFKNKELLTLQKSGWILLSFMFLQTSITALQLMFSTRLFAHETHIKASKVSNLKLVRRWLLISFCLEKNPLIDCSAHWNHHHNGRLMECGERNGRLKDEK